MAGSCEYGSETSGLIKGWEFLDQLIDIKIFKKYAAPCNLN
jgi:hypothetical protein